MKKLVIIFIGMLFLVSCTKIEGDYKFFIGKWRWYKSQYWKYTGGQTPVTKTIYAENFADEYYIEVTKKLEVHWKKNNKIINTIELDGFVLDYECGLSSDSVCTCNIGYQNKNDYTIFLTYSRCSGEEILFCDDLFPITGLYDGNCSVEANYFKRE